MNKSHTTLLRWIALVLIATLFVTYLSSYVHLSRQDFAAADAMEMDGFYFLAPEDTDEWRFRNDAIVRIYYPLILIDNLIGTGRPIGGEPMWGLGWFAPQR